MIGKGMGIGGAPPSSADVVRVSRTTSGYHQSDTGFRFEMGRFATSRRQLQEYLKHFGAPGFPASVQGNGTTESFNVSARNCCQRWNVR